LAKSPDNLLAFSAGVDSTALFFHLLEKNIPFDIAIVNYHTRPTSSEEVEYARFLAQKYGKKIYIKECRLERFSEKTARECRYAFFEEIIKTHGYRTLITAHQLNDRFEWFLMQFSKGAGLKELVAMSEWEEREFYKIYRPFYNVSRKEILSFLDERGIKYFVDESNRDVKFKRNFIREEFSNRFLELYEKGVKNSFEYLEKDLGLLFKKEWHKDGALYYFEKNIPDADIKKCDLILKELGVLMTKAQRDEVIKTGFSCVVQGKVAVDTDGERIFIAPYVKTPMDKKFRDYMRKKRIPPKIRGYLYKTSRNSGGLQ